MIKNAVDAYTITFQALGARVAFMYSSFDTEKQTTADNQRGNLMCVDGMDDELQTHIDAIRNYIVSELNKEEIDINTKIK